MPECKFRAISPETTILHWDEFVADVRSGLLKDYDGFGHLARSETEESDITIVPSDIKHGFMRPAWAQWVAWYNR